MRLGPATQAASDVDSCSCLLSPLGGGMTASARQRSRPQGAMSAASPKPSCNSRSRDRASQPQRWPAALPVLANKVGEEAATPGQPARAHARIWIFPRRFTLVNHRLPLALPLSSGELRNAHVSLNPLWGRMSRRAIKKTAAVVKKLWRMRLPCGRMRKTKNEFSRILSSTQGIQ